jgi:ATP-dependent helicase/nuclease subunit A
MQLSGREHWAQVLYDVIGGETLASAGLQPIQLPKGDGESEETDIVVNDTPFDARYNSTSTARPVAPLRSQEAISTDVVDEQWLPRFLRPSTLGPQVDDPVNTLISSLRGESLYIDAEAVSPQVPLSFEHITTEEVGKIVHKGVVLLIEADVSRSALQSPVAPHVVEIVDGLLEARRLGLDKNELNGLRAFLYEWVLPDLGDSLLWERIEDAVEIYTEESLQSLTRIHNVDIEIHGQADLVLDMGDGTWCVEDIKTALASPSEAHRRRSQLQVEAYAWVLEHQCDPDERVIPRVTTVGVCLEEYSVEWPIGAWRRKLTQSISQ